MVFNTLQRCFLNVKTVKKTGFFRVKKKLKKSNFKIHFLFARPFFVCQSIKKKIGSILVQFIAYARRPAVVSQILTYVSIYIQFSF